MIKIIKTVEEFGELLLNKKYACLVVDFYADWCGPCKAIAPQYAKLSEKYPNIALAKINVEHKDTEEIVKVCKIKSMPTFCIFTNGEYSDKVIGADMNALESLIQNYLKRE